MGWQQYCRIACEQENRRVEHRRLTTAPKDHAMDTIRNEDMIKLARDTINLVILRWQVDKATSNKPVDWQDYHHRLMHARELLAECHTTVENRSTSELSA